MKTDALAKIRGWACENLTDSQAGKLCGMLSEVSRENYELREMLSESRQANELLYADMKRYKGIVNARHNHAVQSLLDENVRMRKLLADMYAYARKLGYDHPPLPELGIDTDE